jgi:hypothetical protein
MQCKDPSNCPDSVSIDGISIKAAEFASCSFKNPSEADGGDGSLLNKEVIKSGTDINIRCQWDTVQLK